jgi:FkbM family methyltransferase
MKQITTRHGEMIIRYENDYISKQLLSAGEYEWDVVEAVALLCKGHKTGIVLDIGANVGTITLPIARMFPQYHVHAFEVQPTVAEVLRENIAANKLTNITVHCIGLGDKACVMEITQPNYEKAHNIGAFSLNEFVHENSIESRMTGDKISVNVRTLDSMPANSPIRCIKLDVEGYERFVLEGAVETLKQHRFPPIVYELWSYNPWWKEESDKLDKFLIGLGYKLQKVGSDTGIAVHS